MLEQGLEEEVRHLMARPEAHRDLPAIKAVGYRQVWDYLEGQHDYDTMVEKGMIATRQLAKKAVHLAKKMAEPGTVRQ